MTGDRKFQLFCSLQVSSLHSWISQQTKPHAPSSLALSLVSRFLRAVCGKSQLLQCKSSKLICCLWFYWHFNAIKYLCASAQLLQPKATCCYITVYIFNYKQHASASQFVVWKVISLVFVVLFECSSCHSWEI